MVMLWRKPFCGRQAASAKKAVTHLTVHIRSTAYYRHHFSLLHRIVLRKKSGNNDNAVSLLDELQPQLYDFLHLINSSMNN